MSLDMPLVYVAEKNSGVYRCNYSALQINFAAAISLHLQFVLAAENCSYCKLASYFDHSLGPREADRM